MKPVRATFALLTLLSVPLLGFAPNAAAQDDTSELYAKAVKSAAYIVTPEKGGYSRGSGSLIDVEKKIVITNYHVVGEKNLVFVQFPMYKKNGELITKTDLYMENIQAGKAIKGKVLFRDQSRDLAIVELASVPAGTPAIPLAKQSPRIGTTVYNIGSPGAVEQLFSITAGVVRAVGHQTFVVGGGDGDSFRVTATMVTATNPANEGDSGGPLINKKGQQVAVTQSVNKGAQQVNFFVDASEVRAFLKEKKINIKELNDEPDPQKEEAVPAVQKKDNKLTTPPMKEPGTGAKPKDDVPPTATPEDEKAAAALLQRSKVFASGEENRPDYVRKLNEIIKKYPATAAGKEAKKILDGLK